MKTAVEQLMIDSFGEDFRMTVNDYQLNAFQKALEKEKKQIIKACFDGAINYGELNYIPDIKLSSEIYYKEKYQNK